MTGRAFLGNRPLWIFLFHTLTQSCFEVSRPPMFLQQVAESFISQLLEVHHAVPSQQVERVPGLVVELDSLAAHSNFHLLFCHSSAAEHGTSCPMPYGDRRAMAQDAWGNTWQIATYRGP
jgi:hypothetical protein